MDGAAQRPDGPPLRVVVVAPPYYEVPPSGYGGIERVVDMLVEGLLDDGHDVILVGVGRCHTRAHFIATNAVAPTEDVGDPVAVELRHALLATRAVRDLRYDIVHDHTRAGLIGAAVRARPTVATVHAALAGPESDLDLYQAVGPAVPLVAVSDAQRADAPELPWIGRVYNGIRTAQVKVRRTADYVLYLGRLSATKGVDLAVAAARRAGCPMVIAGNWTSPSERLFVEEVLRPLLGDGVDWVGPVDDAGRERLLAHAGCFVLPIQWREPFGLVALEAMASGVPVVAMRAGALPELVRDGRTGILCDDVSQLPAAIRAAMSMDASACRPWVEQSFGARRMVDGYVDVYRQVVDGDCRSRPHSR